MTTHRFNINTLEKSKGPLVEFRKEIFFVDNESTIEKGPSNTTIDLHKIELQEGGEKLLRDFSRIITIKLHPEWVDNNSKVNLEKLIHNEEILENTVILNTYIFCQSTKKIIDIVKTKISAIDRNEPIIFSEIDLYNIEGKIIISSNFSRLKSHSDTDTIIADRKNSILGENTDIVLYLDEVDSLGGDHLSIQPAELGKILFKISDWIKSETDTPKLLYHSSFEKYIKGGDYYSSVQLFLMMSLIIYSESNLKWFLFGNNFDEKKEYHNSVKDFIAKMLNMKKNELNDIQSLDDNKKIDKYLELSQMLIENIQISTISYKTIFKQFIEEELKFKNN